MKHDKLLKEARRIIEPYCITKGEKFRLKDHDPADTNGFKDKRQTQSLVEDGAALAVATLKANPHFTNEAQRVAAFVQSGAGCRATYFRHAKQIQPVQTPLKIALTQTGPPATALPCKDYLNQLRRRFGRLGNG